MDRQDALGRSLWDLFRVPNGKVSHSYLPHFPFKPLSITTVSQCDNICAVIGDCWGAGGVPLAVLQCAQFPTFWSVKLLLAGLPTVITRKKRLPGGCILRA